MRVAVGIDAAEDVRRATAVAADGRVPLDREVGNTGAAIIRLAAELAALGAASGWSASTRSAAPPRSRRPCCSTTASGSCTYIPGLTVNRARQGTVGGQAEGDPRDARVIADQLRPRDGFRAVSLGDDAAVERRLLVGRREDLVVDQTRRLTRLCHLLASIHPGLERALEVGGRGPLVLLTRFVGAGEIRSGARRRGLVRPLKAAGIRRPSPRRWPRGPWPPPSATPRSGRPARRRPPSWRGSPPGMGVVPSARFLAPGRATSRAPAPPRRWPPPPPPPVWPPSRGGPADRTA